jgi:hypothetical protein
MIFNTVKHFLGWEECDLSLYSLIHNEFGGNTVTNPAILRFISDNYNVNQRYFVHHNSEGILDAAVCTWEERVAGERAFAKAYGIDIPIAFDEILLPVKESARKIIMPFNSKLLSVKNSASFINCYSKINSHREICIVKSIKGKTKQTLNRKTNLFLKNGGQIHPVKNIGNDNFYDIFTDLFYKRRSKKVEQNKTRVFLNEFNDILFGCYLSYDGKPCAAQLITRTEDFSTVYLDYINSGMDMSYDKFSIGSVCMWENIKMAYEYSQSINKTLRFSFGPPTHKYKDRFCTRNQLSRVIG